MLKARLPKARWLYHDKTRREASLIIARIRAADLVEALTRIRARKARAAAIRARREQWLQEQFYCRCAICTMMRENVQNRSRTPDQRLTGSIRTARV